MSSGITGSSSHRRRKGSSSGSIASGVVEGPAHVGVGHEIDLVTDASRTARTSRRCVPCPPRRPPVPSRTAASSRDSLRRGSAAPPPGAPHAPGCRAGLRKRGFLVLFVRPANENSWFGGLAQASQSAMSRALMATMPMPLRPNAIVLRYMCCQRNSVSNGSAPRQQWLQVQIDDLLRDAGRKRGVADPDVPGIREDLHDQPAVERECPSRRRAAAAGPSGWCRGGAASGTVLPRHSTTRVRISVIFMQSGSRVAEVEVKR